MSYMILPTQDYYKLLEGLNTTDSTFIRIMCDTENSSPTDLCAFEFKNNIYVNPNTKQLIGGIKLITDEFVGLFRAILGIKNNYNDIGTIILGETISTDKYDLKYKFNDIPSYIVTQNAIVSKFCYENTKYALEKLYRSYANCKKKYPNLFNNSDELSYAKCDRWYIYAAILNRNTKLLDTILADGAYAYGGLDRWDYMGLSIVRGDKDIFETLLKYQIYTKFDDTSLAISIVSSKDLRFIIWYRKKYKALTGHDIPFWKTFFKLSSISEFVKLMVTFPWIP